MDVSSWHYIDYLRNPTFVIDGRFASELRQENAQLQNQFQSSLNSIRPELENAYAISDEARPLTFRESLVESGNKSTLISIAKQYYDDSADTKLNRERVREFIHICPAFRAIAYANLMPFYDRSLRDQQYGERFRCGRHDLSMAAYLPYCDEFVTDEGKGEQERCLKRIVEVAGLQSDVVCLDEFRKRVVK